jgi:glucose-6-phosphate dehydrogenase assembly protein OpcA
MEAAVIVDLPDTTTNALTSRLVEVRADTGSMALSRVLTLIMVIEDGGAEAAIRTASEASRQHPCRIIVVVRETRRGRPRLDGQIRVGGDAGASEIVVLQLFGPLAANGRSVATPLLLADSPIVVWWPNGGPKAPAEDSVGSMATRRVTDSARMSGTPRAALGRLAKAHVPGDTDLAWSRVTLWRGLLTSALDQPPFEPVTAATVAAAPESPSGVLLAAWLTVRLRCPVTLVRSRAGSGIISVRLERASGTVDLVRPRDDETALLRQPGQPDRTLALPHRSDAECVADELRRLDADEVYTDTLVHGVGRVKHSRRTASEAIKEGRAPSPAEAERIIGRLRRAAAASGGSRMVEQMDEPTGSSDTDTVRKASAARLADVKKARS